MLTSRELLLCIGVPVIVSALVALIGFWRRWAWALPLGAGVGFVAGYIALSGVPRLPPIDGTDWLFWVAIPVTGLGALDAAVRQRWGWLLGAAAGVMVFRVGWPLVPGTVTAGALIGVAVLAAALGSGLCFVAGFAEPRLGSPAIAAALCVTVGGAGVLVMSSHLRVVGVYGIAAAAALGPVAVLSAKVRAARGVAIVAFSLLAGLLIGGHYYADPGVPWTRAGLLMAAPILLLPCAVIPTRRTWIRGVVAAVLVAVVVGAVVGPTALAAKRAAEGRAAEGDPYGGYSE